MPVFGRKGAPAPALARWLVVGTAALVLTAGCGTAPAEPPLDLIVRGGMVHDGGGGEGQVADVGIRGDRIVFVGDGAKLRATRTIVATGMIVAPGFIDPHTHSGSDLQSDDTQRRAALNHLMQGVTTVFIGNDGDGSPEIGAALAAVQTKGVGVNVASYVGFGAVRRAVVGRDARDPTDEELARMRRLVIRAMCQGALGFSTGLYYAPQSFAKTPEVIALAREAAVRGGVYDTHLRDEGSDNVGLAAAVEEALEVGRAADLPVHIAHIKALGVDVQGASSDIIARIEREQAGGRKVTADQYPWRASGTRVSNALVPRWAMDGGAEATRKRLADPALRERIVTEMTDNLRRRGGAESLLITSGPHAGKGLDKVAAEWRVDPVEAAIRIVRDDGDARVASFNMTAADIGAFAARPWVVTGSDASEGHPRKFGTFPLAWTTFVRDQAVMTPGRFIRRSSAQTAEIFGLKDRGYLRPGYFADVIVFDPQTFAARADFEHPRELSVGVSLALVNGRVAVDEGKPTQALAGRGLPRPSNPEMECPHE